ncbi:hypothetical protein V6615_09780 [Oscillospiraceae bacterium PP1C4]
MIKQDLRLFFSSFFITLLLAGWIAAFLIVDSSSSRYENENVTPALALTRTDVLRYDMDLLGRKYTFHLDQLNQLEAWRKEYACLVTPRQILTAEKAYGMAVNAWNKYYPMYKEYEYQQNVAKSEQPAAP